MDKPINETNDFERFDEIEDMALKLTALLNGMYGPQGESFRSRSASDQDTVLWLAVDLIDRIRTIAAEVTSA
jgi:hypothetical protein